MKASLQGFCSRTEGVGAVFEDIFLIDGKRTPFGKYMGTLSTVSPTDLGILSSRAVLAATGIPASEIDQTIVANIGQASADSFFLPRHIALYSGATVESPALMVQRICGSGIEVIGVAAQEIAMGKARLVLGCGTDTMSRFPLVSYTSRQGFQLGKPEFLDLLWEALNDTAAVPMGATADHLAKKYGLTRTEVDAFGKRSQDRYFDALGAGAFKDEVIRVEPKGAFEAAGLKPRQYRIKGADAFEQDEHARRTTLENLAKLPPVFSKEGPTTAGTASGIVDGASSVLVASGEYVRSHGLKPLGRVRAVASAGVDPALMGIGPVPAIRAVLRSLNLKLSDIDLFEINEAFGAQALSVARALELDENKLNVNGGAIAIGHPLAATGCRLATTCLKTLKSRKGRPDARLTARPDARLTTRLGIVSACIGGGQGIAMVLEAVE